MQHDRWPDLPDRTPVIIGVGVAGQQCAEPADGVDAFALMADAARRAGEDSGRAALLSRVDLVEVPEGSWSHDNAAGQVAAEIGSPEARTVVVQVGIPQQALLNDVYDAIAGGTAEVALVVGGESSARNVRAQRAGVDLGGPARWPRKPHELRSPAGEIVHPVEIEAGMWTPVEEYALIESALRHAEHRTVDEHCDDIARLWSGFSEVAAGFEHADRRTPRSPEELRDPGEGNRLIAFPYTRLHCSHLHVDQAAAVLITSLGNAREAGIDRARVVFPRVALESSDSVAVIRRRDLHRWPAMQVLGAVASTVLGRPLDAIEHVELYSCFPVAVRVQQRELGLPLDGVPTITGGMPFAGGPWNSFVLQATAAMVDRVRSDPGTLGMVTTVSGFLHKPGLAVYSTEPGAEAPLVADLADDAAALTPTRPVAERHVGPATIAACTVAVDRDGGRRVVTILDTPGDERWVGFSDDPALLDRALTEELIGAAVVVDGFAITDAHPGSTGT